MVLRARTNLGGTYRGEESGRNRKPADMFTKALPKRFPSKYIADIISQFVHETRGFDVSAGGGVL